MKTKTEKIYNVKTADGTIEVSMKRKGVDGKFHSIKSPYPVYDTKRDADGNLVIVRLTRKQAEKELVNQLMVFYPNGVGY